MVGYARASKGTQVFFQVRAEANTGFGEPRQGEMFVAGVLDDPSMTRSRLLLPLIRKG
jgi:hypothetical protein